MLLKYRNLIHRLQIQRREEKILDSIAQNGHVTCSDVERLLAVSQATASRILKCMITEDKICNSKKPPKWVVNSLGCGGRT